MSMDIALDNILEKLGTTAIVGAHQIKLMISPDKNSGDENISRLGAHGDTYNIITSEKYGLFKENDVIIISGESYRIESIKPFKLRDKTVYIWAKVLKFDCSAEAVKTI